MLSGTTRRVQYSVSAGYSATYSITFAYFTTSEIKAVLTPDSGSDVELTTTTDFTVSAAGSSGTLTRVTDWDTLLPEGATQFNTLTIYREIEKTQDTNYPNGAALNATTLMRTLDRTVGMVQELSEESGRKVTTPITDSAVDLILPGAAERANRFLACDASGNIIAAVALQSGVTVTTFAETILDDENAQTVLSTLGVSEFAKTVMAAFPAHYERNEEWAAKTVSIAADRYTLISPAHMTININDSGYILDTQQEIDLSDSSSWDTTAVTDYTDAANRDGKDFYFYACEPTSGTSPVIKLSANSTYPAGYTANSSRKCGGFHTLCANVGTISGHDLSGYVAGDILPESVWDLKHRPVSDPEGMVYVDGIGKWVDIYLASWSGSVLQSINGGTVADGASAKKFHWYKFAEEFGKIGKRLPMQQEFVVAAKGSPEGTNIAGSTDPGTTGGHSDTASRRIISNDGIEDATGVLWQWGADGGSEGRAASYVNEYDTDAASDNSVAMGQSYSAPNRPLRGGYWNHGAICGSRSSYWSYSPLLLSSSVGARGVAEPKA